MEAIITEGAAFGSGVVFCDAGDDRFFSFELRGEGEDSRGTSCDGTSGTSHPIIARGRIVLLEVDVRIDSSGSYIGAFGINNFGGSISWERGSEAGYLAVFDADFNSWCENVAGSDLRAVRT